MRAGETGEGDIVEALPTPRMAPGLPAKMGATGLTGPGTHSENLLISQKWEPLRFGSRSTKAHTVLTTRASQSALERLNGWIIQVSCTAAREAVFRPATATREGTSGRTPGWF